MVGMNQPYWQKQSNEALFPQLEWNKPERRDQAGRVLIIGGYLHNLNGPAKSYETLKKLGVGDIKVALPDRTKRLLGSTLADAVFLPSTKSGEFAKEGFEGLIDYANWADTLLLPGDVGRNSQTTILLADLLDSSEQRAIITRDAVDTLVNTPELILNRPHTTLVISFSQLQQIAKRVNWPDPFTFTMGLVKFVENIHNFGRRYPASIVTLHENTLVCAVDGNITTTSIRRHSRPDRESSEDMDSLVKPEDDNTKRWRLEYASLATAYQTWNPNQPLEALTYSAYLFSHQ